MTVINCHSADEEERVDHVETREIRGQWRSKHYYCFNEKTTNIEFETIESADKFTCDFGEAAGDDVVKATADGFYFEYHKGQYKREYIKELMKECIKDGVKTQVQMYCCMVKNLHN